MTQSRTSVVVCTRDRPDSLRRCLQSIAASRIPPLEVIVVDQSSDEKTLALVQDMALKTPLPVHHLPLDGEGQTRARNAGLHASRGDIVAFTDDDCVVDPEWLGVMEEELSDDSLSCVCGKSQPANHTERPRQAMLSTLNHKRRAVARGRRNPIVVGRGNNMAFRKTVLVEIGGFNERIGVGTPVAAGDDLDVFYRTLESGRTILCTPHSVVFHEQPDDWQDVIHKKRCYSLSSAAVLSSRLRNRDLFAGALLTAKITYEFGYLLCGGIMRLNRNIAAVGWHSFVGSLGGIKFAFDSDFQQESSRLYDLAREHRVTPTGERESVVSNIE